CGPRQRSLEQPWSAAPGSGPLAAGRSRCSPLAPGSWCCWPWAPSPALLSLYSAGTLAILEDHPKVRELPKSITAQMEIPSSSADTWLPAVSRLAQRRVGSGSEECKGHLFTSHF
uniref:Uncharacterized protein n=1 Tax=Chrysemys picta bellii TaxID=8478 RepID=A0A8C3H8E5_CHRPI